MNNYIVSCKDINKEFNEGENKIKVLNGVNIDIKEGELVSIVGKSGSGKSTLLHIIGGLDVPTSGKVEICGTAWGNLSSKERDRFRNFNLGVVYQQHYLLREFNVQENVALPLIVRGVNKKEAINLARDMLTSLHLQDRLHYSPSALSGGERQRVSLARALITKPKCLIADEPTGNLDTSCSEDIISIIKSMSKENNMGVILVTHDIKLADSMDRKITIVDGFIVNS